MKEETADVFRMSEISLQLDTYDDIFSDFDPRPYTERALSDDFLQEAKRASRDKPSGNIALHFIMPREKRKIEHEQLIKRRLREHFRKHYVQILEETMSIKKKGVFMAFLGILLIIIASYISSLQSASFYMHFLIVLLEPAGWFTAWTGLDEIYYTTKQKQPDLVFYEKMSNADIAFLSY